MFVPVEPFYSLIEQGTQVVGCIVATLGKPDGWLVALSMGRIDCHTPCLVGVALGNGVAFVLGMSDDVVKEQIVTMYPPLCLFDVLTSGNFCCLRCSCGPGGIMVLLSSICSVGLGAS